MADEIKGSRLSRLWALGRLGARALPMAVRRIREVGPAPAPAAGLDARTLKRATALAEDAFQRLGDLKGLSMKLGQMASYMDGLVPEPYREVYQQALARLQQAAPAMSWAAIEPVLVEDLGAAVSERFGEFDPEPFAAASIGQVHRATLRDGREVAVKVQYPGVEKALRADLANAGMMRSFKVPFLRTTNGDPRAWMDGVWSELHDRFMEELDYVHEADMQERFRALFAGDPVVRVPAVHRVASGRRVLTSDFVRGRTLDEVSAEAPSTRRDAYGVALHRFLMDSLHIHHLLYGDPHPGNYLFPDDGTVVVLDFGCVKEVPPSMSAAMAGYLSAAIRATRTSRAEDWEAFDQAVSTALRIDRDDAETWSHYRAFLLYVLRPWLEDEPFEFTPEYAAGSVDLALGGMREIVFSRGFLPHLPVLPAIPPDFTLLNRLQWGFYSVMARLRARHPWQRELPPHVRGEAAGGNGGAGVAG